MFPGEDLYKGNGRVKQQLHIINQGPFQTVQVHNYQSKDKHDVNTKEDFELGGNNHFDIYVFRNAGMFSNKEKPLIKYGIKDLIKDRTRPSLYHEKAKESVVTEFLNFISGRISKDNLISNIEDHDIPVKIMSSVYKSHVQYKEGESPLVSFSF